MQLDKDMDKYQASLHQMSSYLWILLQFQCLLINILASVRNHYPWINRTWVFTSLQKWVQTV